MKISYQWLADFIDWKETDPQKIADRITSGMGEVDDVVDQGALMKNCVVGKVATLAKHPNADKLSLCTIQSERGMHKVVCGGTNLHEGMLVAFAHVGATVKHGKEIVTLKKATIRGEDSEGMICAAEELDLSADFPPKPEDGTRPIVDLTALSLTVGMPLAQALGKDDVVFHIDNHAITNRPDLFSHIGVARECVALGLATWKKKTGPKGKKSSDNFPLSIVNFQFPKSPLPFHCINDIPHLVPFYNGCLLEADSIGVTPDWMKKRLEATGWRPINPPVDITNYVAMEIGMPLHCFDADDFSGDIRIRASKKGERIVTLDKADRVLPDGAIIISDDKGIFDLLGIMGGLRSSTKEKTKRMFLHAAILDGATIRRTIIATGHRTDAATVYEKGVPTVAALWGLTRAIELFLQICPGARISSKLLTEGKETKPKAMVTDLLRVQKIIGMDIPEKEVMRILSDLGCDVKSRKSKAKATKTSSSIVNCQLSIVPPPWRRDLTLPADIAEEVARIHGYGAIPPVMPAAMITPPERDPRIHMLRDSLKEQGFTELLELAFANEKLLRTAGLDPSTAVKIVNPLGEELSLLRTHLLPSLLHTAASQLRESAGDIQAFEYGHVFSTGSEKSQVALLVAAKGKTTIHDDPFLRVKSAALGALRAIGYDADVKVRTTGLQPFMHPGRSADIVIKGALAGTVFEIHPSIRSNAGLPERAAAAVIDWDALTPLAQTIRTFAPLPVFPAVSYDETIGLSMKESLQEKLRSLQSFSSLLESVQVIDLYQTPTGEQTVTLRFVYRAPDRTLSEAEVEAIHKAVATVLRKGR